MGQWMDVLHRMLSFLLSNNRYISWAIRQLGIVQCMVAQSPVPRKLPLFPARRALGNGGSIGSPGFGGNGEMDKAAAREARHLKREAEKRKKKCTAQGETIGGQSAAEIDDLLQAVRA
jgi:hypothetical protein